MVPKLPASGKIAGYRVYRDGVLVRQVRGRRARDRDLAPATRYRFTVAAIDTHGYMGPAARVSASTADPAPTEGRAHAFLLASTGESFRDLQRHYRQIGTVYPTYFECGKTRGALVGDDDPLVTRWAQLRQIRVLPRFDCQRPATLHLILTDPAVRAATIAGLVGLVRRHGYDGINIDFENGYATDRDALTAFASELAAAASCDREGPGGRGLGEVPAHDHRPVGPLRLRGARRGGRPRVRHELGLALVDVGSRRTGRHGEVPAGRRLRGLDAEQGAVRARDAHVRHGLARGRRAGAHGRGTRVCGRAGADRAARGDAGARPGVRRMDVQLHRRRRRPARGVVPGRDHDRETGALARDRGLGIGFWRLGHEDQRIWDDPQIAPGSGWP